MLVGYIDHCKLDVRHAHHFVRDPVRLPFVGVVGGAYLDLEDLIATALLIENIWPSKLWFAKSPVHSVQEHVLLLLHERVRMTLNILWYILTQCRPSAFMPEPEPGPDSPRVLPGGKLWAR